MIVAKFGSATESALNNVSLARNPAEKNYGYPDFATKFLIC